MMVAAVSRMDMVKWTHLCPCIPLPVSAWGKMGTEHLHFDNAGLRQGLAYRFVRF
jgi:hypothetical protein